MIVLSLLSIIVDTIGSGKWRFSNRSDYRVDPSEGAVLYTLIHLWNFNKVVTRSLIAGFSAAHTIAFTCAMTMGILTESTQFTLLLSDITN